MATNFTQSSIDPTTDAGFRAWGSALSSALQAVGLVRVTGETGIVDWSTAVRANAWFDLYRFDDALAATKPVYVKIFGAAGGWTGSRTPFGVCVGTGTDGSGGMVGVFTETSTSNAEAGASSSIVNTGSPIRNNYVSFSDGQLNVVWGVNPSADSTVGYFSVARTVNDLGAATGDGATIFLMSSANGVKGATKAQHLNFNTPASMGQAGNTSTGWIPQGITSSLVGSTPQIFPHWVSTPIIRPVISHVAFLSAEIAMGDDFTVKPIGGASGVSRTYMTMTGRAAHGSSNAATTSSIAILWE